MNEARLEAYARKKPSLRELIEIWTSTDEDLARKAAAVLSFSGKPGITAIVSAKPALPEQKVWAARTLISSAPRPTTRVASYLDLLLTDSAPVPQRGGPAEEAPPPQRVCDQVYSAVLPWLSGTTESVMLKQRAFAQLDATDRDAEIRTFRRSPRWRKLIR